MKVNLAIAETDIFNNDEDIVQSKKLGLFEKSLLNNRADFVEFFLERSQSFDLKVFLEQMLFLKLYTNSIKQKNSPLHILNIELNETKAKVKKNSLTDIKGKKIEFQLVEQFLRSRFRGFNPKFFAEDSEKEPEIHLFVWALLSNKIELAKIFWKIGKVNKNLFVSNIFTNYYFKFKIANALFAAQLLKNVSNHEKLTDLKEKLEEASK